MLLFLVYLGTKRKVNVLIGLLNHPRVLILDEPTVGIDLKSRFDIHHLLNQMKRNCLIILTTHHLDEVEALADCIKVIGVDPFYKKYYQTNNGNLSVIIINFKFLNHLFTYI